MSGNFRVAAIALALVGLSEAAQGQPTTELRPETVQAFETYVRSVERSLEASLDGSRPLAWLAAGPDQRASILAGEILTQQVDTGDLDVPNGMIHDWIGAAFLPGVTATETVGFLQDVGRHKDYYDEVLDSRILGRDGDVIRSYLRLKKQKVLTVVLDTEHEARYRKLSDVLWYMRSRSTRITQVKDAGSPDERELPLGEDSGFLWRLNAYWRILETSEGTWVVLRTVSLSRGIPFGLGIIIRPFITSVPKESLTSTLSGTRTALLE